MSLYLNILCAISVLRSRLYVLPVWRPESTSTANLHSDETEFGEIADDRRDQSLKTAGNVDLLVVEVEPCQVRPGAVDLADRLPVFVAQLEVLRAVADQRADLREEAVQVGEALQRHRHARDHVADVVRLKDALVLYEELLHSLRSKQQGSVSEGRSDST